MSASRFDGACALVRLAGAAAISLTIGAATPGSVSAATDLNAVLPFDSHVSRSTLDDGIKVFVRENEKPEQRAELRLVVKAGSVDEDDDQRGLAHFVEHMLFNGTESFAGNEIITYLESIGSRFGADLNAYTSFDETVYMLQVPTDREGLLDEGIHILAEFAARATFDSTEVERERGVVMDEWRRGRGAAARARDEQLPIVLRGSQYAQRLPIGLPEIISTAPRDRLVRFYRDWYRPERMAVIAAGDFDAKEVEAKIRAAFANVTRKDEARRRTDWDVPATADTAFTLADDPELTRTGVGISWKKPLDADSTYAAYRRDLVRSMAISMVNDRLAERARDADPPFLGAGLGVDSFGRRAELVELDARVQEGEEARGLEAIVLELRRATTHGFVDTEVDRTRRDLLAGIEASYAEREKTQSSSYVSELTRHFLDGEPVPGIETEVNLWREMLPGISAGECAASLRELASGGGVTVTATGPTRAAMTGEAELRDALRRAASGEVPPYQDRGAAASLIASPGAPGRATKVRDIPEIEASEWLLSNGVRFFLRPTAFQDDEILFSGTSLGGLSRAPDADLLSASMALSILGESGYGGHSAIELGKILAGKVASCRPFYDERTHGVAGSSTVADVPTALELAVLVMTSPNRDEAAFARVMERLQADVANRDRDPGVKFQDRLVAINTSDSPRRRPVTTERLKEIDLDTALAFHRNSFANAADFTFFFVGNLDESKLIPEIERTIGSLPRTDAKPAEYVVHSYPLPKKTVKEIVRAGTEPKSSTAITFHSYDGDDPRQWHRVRTASSIYERRLRETLREALGATYGASAGYDRMFPGSAEGALRVRYGANPTDAERLGNEAMRIAKELEASGPTEEEVTTEKTLQLRELESSLQENGFWLGSLRTLWVLGRPLPEILDRKPRIDALTQSSIHETMRTAFKVEPHSWVAWLPVE